MLSWIFFHAPFSTVLPAEILSYPFGEPPLQHIAPRDQGERHEDGRPK
jgi:hypothetical protein